MATILKHKLKPILNLHYSLSFRVALICALVALLLILVLNVMIINLESSVLSIKETELTTAASEFSASLSDYGLDYDLNFSQNFLMTNRRIIVTDETLRVVFDSFNLNGLGGKFIFHPSAVQALRGKDYFSFSRSSSSIDSCASAPVFLQGKIIGTVSVFESDIATPSFFSTLEITSLIISVVIFIFLLVTSYIITRVFVKRISLLISSIKDAHKDDTINKIVPLHADELSPVLDEFNNISDRFNYVQAMRQAFVSDASHELRTPLAAIRLLCESITQTDNVDSETVCEFMEDIILEVDRMSHTAEKLLVLAKLDNSSRSAAAPIPLSEIVSKMVTAFQPIAEDKNVTIIPYIEENCSILGDMEGANQIVGNLIDNAIKYNNVGGTLRIFLFSNGNSCTFITDDSGIGIPPEYRERIFERFYRVDKSREHDGRGGSGLGLSIVKRNVESFGGTISISDSVSGGTRFTVVFPNLMCDEEM